MTAWLTERLTNPALAAFVNDHAWVWPVAEIVHFIGMALLAGTIGLLDLRMLGFGQRLPLRDFDRLVRWGIAGFGANFLSGMLFIMGHPNGAGAYLENESFRMKALLLFFAGLNVALFYVSGTARRVAASAPDDPVPSFARVVGLVSLVLWTGVIYFGRMIMYAG